MKRNQQWKKLLALTLCIVQCAMLAIPTVSAQESAPDAMDATSVAVPEPTLSDVPVTVTMKEENSYWWGNASQSTVKLGDPITNISDRYSWVFDSPVMEGYGDKQTGTANEGQTSNYFEFDAAWAEFDVSKQDLMMYIELPEAGSSFRFKHICMNWTWPAPKGMTYEYLAADGRSWARGTIDSNYQVNLPVGFKGYVRVHVDTAANVTDWSGIKSLQYFAIRFDAYGGSYGAAKIGGVWFVDKGEAYQVSVDGGETVALTTSTPLPKPGEGGQSAWTGDVLTAHYQSHENGTIGGTPTSLVMEKDQNWWGNPTQVTFELTEGITSLGESWAYKIDSPIGEGFNQPDAKTAPFFTLYGSWIGIDILTQDFMFYIELPEVSNGLRLHGFTATAGSYCWPNVVGMKYQYLSVDSHEWMDGVVANDGNKTMALPAGFKGFIRMKMDTVANFDSLPSTNLSIHCLQFYIDRFGGDDGAVKLSGVWTVSKEDTRYISIDGGEMLCMTDAVEPTWIGAASAFEETAALGEAAVTTVMYDKAWGLKPKATATVGECINPLNDGQKSIVIDSVQHEGYTLDDSSERTYPGHNFHANDVSVNMAKNDVMIYLELPERASSIRIDSFYFYCGGSVLTPSPGSRSYAYLPVDGDKWIDGGLSDGNYTYKLTPGFKGYVRFDVGGGGGWWQYHDGDTSWKNSTATLDYISIRLERFGADLGAAKFGGIWAIDKSDFIDISVDGGEAQPMTSYVYVDPVLNAVSTLAENPETIWLPKVSAAAGQVTTENSITKISDRKAVVINSESVANGTSVTVDVNAELAEDQDVMLYVELAADSKVLFNSAFAGITYKYLSINSGNWIEANSANGQISLPAGFKGYVRLAIAAGNVNTLNFMVDAFGGDKGAFKLGGVWFVSKSDALYASVDGADAVALGNLTDGLGLVEKWNVVLQDDIGVNFYIRVNENIRDTAQIKITVDGKSVSHAVSALTADANGSYKVKVDVSAAQMTSPICVQVVNDGQISAEKTYTVAQYAKTVLNSDDVGAYYHLIKEMLNYGGAAQTYFGINDHDMANAGLTGVAYNDVPATAETQYSVSGSAAGVQLYGATLVLRNQVAVRIYFQISDDIAAHSFVCGDEALTPVKAGDKYYVEIDGINPQDLDENVTVTVDNGLTVSYSPMNYMVRMNQNGSESLKELIRALYNYHLAADRFVLAQDDPARYDLKVTTFNVGQWYHGTTNLDVYGAQVHTHSGITPAAVENAYNLWMKAFPMHDADLICMQEMRDVFYINNQNNDDASDDVILMADDVLGQYFDNIGRYTGVGYSDYGQFSMWMGMMNAKNGRYQLRDVTGGQLLSSNQRYTRAYAKGYITVNGHDIAVYSIHTSDNNAAGDYLTQQMKELIELAKQDEYVIIMGDTNAINGPHEFQPMLDAGFSMANCSKFGSFYTYEYNTNYCIDNIFVSPNIEIVYAECEYDKVGGSDHFPLSAYLVIKD